MVGESLDWLARGLALGERSRRETLRALAGTGVGMASLVAISDAEAKKRKKKKKTCKKPKPVLQTTILSCPGPKDVGFSANRRFAQTFTATETGALTTALVEVSTVPAGTDFVVEIRAVDGSGVPTSAILASADILDVALTQSSPPRTLTALFYPPADVEQGVQYALVLTDAPPGSGYTGSLRAGDACLGQVFFDSTASETFAPQPANDLVFAVSIAFVA